MKASWKRYGLIYVTTLRYELDEGNCMTIVRTLDFISYHLIKWKHGEDRLMEMANKRFNHEDRS